MSPGMHNSSLPCSRVRFADINLNEELKQLGVKIEAKAVV